MNIEKRQADFQKMKKVVQRKFKGAKVVYTGGRYTIQANGKNVVNPEWPDLQFADTVYDAYHNAFTSEFWTRQYNKKPKKVQASIVNMVGDDTNLPHNQPTIDKERKSKIKIDEEVFDEVDYSYDRMEDWG
mgnify:CR=1 FL=1|tara:strand:+ start:12894 stop:13286 length:393 start_codon:yes stop_codon:yes gene_type:complete